MSGPLDGIRVVDMTTMLSGPWAAMILADQGADVVKVEVPGKGDHVRSLGNQRAGMSAMFLNINRNKRSISVDVKHPQGREIVRDLARGADVFMQNFRPGVVDRLGVGEADIRQVAPEIIYTSISGFGDEGPWVGKPVYDPIIQAVSGLTTVQAGSDVERPRLIRTVLPDKLAAVTVAQSISAALVSKLRTGHGQHLRISMLDSVLYFLWASDMGAQTYPDRQVSHQEAASFIDLIYETLDGHMTVAVMSNKEWVGLTKALDRPEWLSDERFATPSARDRHVNERLVMTQEVLKTRATDDWMARLEAHDVPCAPALKRSEVIHHPQVVASGSIVETQHHAAGRLRQARSPARFARTPSSIRRGAPLLGEHNDEVLRELGYSDARLESLRAAKVIGSEQVASTEL
jgi:crotonobetainyl-CoA:carnitine CoA-transferase CaiB-like acyl-CoA transferase